MACGALSVRRPTFRLWRLSGEPVNLKEVVALIGRSVAIEGIHRCLSRDEIRELRAEGFSTRRTSPKLVGRPDRPVPERINCPRRDKLTPSGIGHAGVEETHGFWESMPKWRKACLMAGRFSGGHGETWAPARGHRPPGCRSLLCSRRSRRSRLSSHAAGALNF